MRGFTLLEVMISLAILAGVVLTVISSFNHQLSLATSDKEETVALLLARAKLEEVELLPGNAASATQTGTFAPGHPEISWKVETAPAEVPMFTKITVTATWGGGARKETLVHYRAQ